MNHLLGKSSEVSSRHPSLGDFSFQNGITPSHGSCGSSAASFCLPLPPGPWLDDVSYETPELSCSPLSYGKGKACYGEDTPGRKLYPESRVKAYGIWGVVCTGNYSDSLDLMLSGLGWSVLPKSQHFSGNINIFFQKSSSLEVVYITCLPSFCSPRKVDNISVLWLLFYIKSLPMENVFLGAGQKDLAFQVALLTHSLTAHLNLPAHQHCQRGKLPLQVQLVRAAPT